MRVGLYWFGRLLFLFARLHRLDQLLAGAGRRQHGNVEGLGGGDVILAAGANGQGAQAVLATQVHQLAQIELTFAFRQLVQRQHQGDVLEEVGGLRHFLGQLPVQALQVVVRQLQHGDGEHAALELEHGVLVEEIGLAHGSPTALNGHDL